VARNYQSVFRCASSARDADLISSILYTGIGNRNSQNMRTERRNLTLTSAPQSAIAEAMPFRFRFPSL